MITLTHPGLNYHKIHKSCPLPAGPFTGLSMKQALQQFNYAKMSACVLGTNNWEVYFRKPAKDAVKDLLDLIQFLYDGTNFEVVFIATIFPRQDFYTQTGPKLGRLNYGLKEFNDCLLASRGKIKLEINNKSGIVSELKWKVVDMTSIFKYDKMFSDEFYCSQEKHGVHLKGIYAERFLEKLNSTVKEYLKRSNRANKKAKKPNH